MPLKHPTAPITYITPNCRWGMFCLQKRRLYFCVVTTNTVYSKIRRVVLGWGGRLELVSEIEPTSFGFLEKDMRIFSRCAFQKLCSREKNTLLPLFRGGSKSTVFSVSIMWQFFNRDHYFLFDEKQIFGVTWKLVKNLGWGLHKMNLAT